MSSSGQKRTTFEAGGDEDVWGGGSQNASSSGGAGFKAKRLMTRAFSKAKMPRLNTFVIPPSRRRQLGNATTSYSVTIGALLAAALFAFVFSFVSLFDRNFWASAVALLIALSCVNAVFLFSRYHALNFQFLLFVIHATLLLAAAALLIAFDAKNLQTGAYNCSSSNKGGGGSDSRPLCRENRGTNIAALVLMTITMAALLVATVGSLIFRTNRDQFFKLEQRRKSTQSFVDYLSDRQKYLYGQGGSGASSSKGGRESGDHTTVAPGEETIELGTQEEVQAVGGGSGADEKSSYVSTPLGSPAQSSPLPVAPASTNKSSSQHPPPLPLPPPSNLKKVQEEQTTGGHVPELPT